MTVNLGELGVAMSEQLMKARQGLILSEMRVTRACIAKINAGFTIDSTGNISLSAQEYAATFSLSVSEAYTQLKTVATTLTSKKVVFEDGSTSRWVEHAEYLKGSGEIRLRFAEELLPHILPCTTLSSLQALGQGTGHHAPNNPPVVDKENNVPKEQTLTEQDHADMDTFLGFLLDGYKSGAVTRSTAIGTLAHVVAAVDMDNYEEARKWFQQGRKFLSSEQSA